MPATRLLLLSLAMLPASLGYGQERRIEFPDTPPYVTLVCDFHMHTVFSDGSVWPNIRVQEALKDGLDVIAMTEHLEYQPHADDIPHPDRNRAFEIARQESSNSSLLVLNGSEITRNMPPGHSNAIFVEDANRLLMDDPVEVFREANRQGAFVFWNHPNWTSQREDGVATLTDMHRMLIGENLLQGIEVANETTYSDEALQIALENNLTLIGTSDIHCLVDWQFEVPEGGHRPATLVFASDRTPGAIKEALLARRTAVWFNDTLIGRETVLMPLIDASLQVANAQYKGSTTVLAVTLRNTSDAKFLLRNLSEFTFHEGADILKVKPHGETSFEVKTVDEKESVALTFEVLNAVTAPKKHPAYTAQVQITPD